jgi:predicted secreted protein
MTTAKIGYLAQFWIDDAASLMTKIAEVIEIGLPNPQQDDVEATHFESPGRAREYIPGLINNGEITIAINYVGGSASDLLLTAAMAAGEARDCEIWIPTTTDFWKFSFSGIVKGYEKAIPIDDRQTATVTIRVNGAVTEASDS